MERRNGPHSGLNLSSTARAATPLIRIAGCLAIAIRATLRSACIRPCSGHTTLKRFPGQNGVILIHHNGLNTRNSVPRNSPAAKALLILLNVETASWQAERKTWVMRLSLKRGSTVRARRVGPIIFARFDKIIAMFCVLAETSRSTAKSVRNFSSLFSLEN